MWLNKSVVIIITLLKILDITCLKFIYIYIYINKLGFRIGTLNPKYVFPLYVSAQEWTEVDQNGLKWTQMDQMDRI